MQRYKVVQTKHSTEIFQYPPNLVNRQLKGRMPDTYTKSFSPSSDSIYKRITRNRRTIHRLISNNFTQNHKFLTLTYEKKQTDFQDCKLDFKRFVRRLKTKHSFSNFKYLAIIERHKDDSLHIHACLSVGYIPKKSYDDCWSLGFTFIKNLKGVKSIAGYLTKYLTKDLNPPPSVPIYIKSKNLEPPTVYWESEGLKTLKYIPNNVYYKEVNKYSSDYGTITQGRYINY